MSRYDYFWLGLVCLYAYIHSINFVIAEQSGTNKNSVDIDKLRQLETHVLGLVAKIAEQNVKIANLETRIANQDIRITNQDLKFVEQDAQIANQDRKFSEQDAKLSNQEAEISNQVTKIGNQDSKISAHDAKFADKELEISKLNNRIGNQDIKIANQDTKIANQDTKSSDQDAKIAKQDTKIANQDAKISEQDAKIAKQDAQLISLKTEIAVQSSGTAKHNETVSINVFPKCHPESQFSSGQTASELLRKYSNSLMKAVEILQDVTNTSCVSANGLYVRSTAKVIYGREKLMKKEKPEKVRDCEEIKTRFPMSESGVYSIYPGLSNSSMRVFCDMDTDGGGWTDFTSVQQLRSFTGEKSKERRRNQVFQSRKDGSVYFERTWKEYADGFGNLTGEFWLGNDNIHRLVSMSPHMLRVDMEDFEGERKFAKYSTFSVAGKEDKYTLTIGGYSGDAGDSMGYHNQMNFTTTDNDNDLSGRNCAASYRGGWWYNSCHHSNLNGFYYETNPSSHAKGINWLTWKGHGYSLKVVTLKVKSI